MDVPEMVEGHSWAAFLHRSGRRRKKTERKPRQPPGPSRSPQKSSLPAHEGGPASLAGSRPSFVRAQSRVGKLEAAISALGEHDPANPRERSCSACDLRRITWTKEFIARAQKRAQKRGGHALMQEEVVKAQETLRHEEALLSKMERHCRSSPAEHQVWPSPTISPVHFATELATLRECVQEFRRERRVESRLCAVGGRRVGLKTRILAIPASDLMLSDHDSLTQCTVRRGQICWSRCSIRRIPQSGPVYLEQGLDASLLAEVWKIVCEMRSSWRADWRGGTSRPFFPEFRPCSNSRVIGQ